MRKLAFAVVLIACSGNASAPPREQPALDAGAPSHPRFDECPEGDAIARLGGGCDTIGVPKGECGEGFVDDAGGCAPTLPKDACKPGELAVPGETSCHPVADCGTDPWGTLPSGTVLYVDASSVATDADGSKAKPFASLRAAVDAATPDSIVALAEGRYEESLAINKPLRIYGRCPSKVSIASTGAIALALRSQIELHRVGVSGSRACVVVDDSKALLEEVWIHDCGDRGLSVQSPGAAAEAIVRRTLIESARDAGLILTGAKVTLESSVVRDIKERTADGRPGNGIIVQPNTGKKIWSELVLTRSVVQNDEEVGISVLASTVRIDRSVVRDTRARPDGQGGIGINVAPYKGAPAPQLTIERTVVRNNRQVGISLTGVTATLDRVTVRDTQPRGDGEHGFGLQAKASSVLTLRRSLFADNTDQAITIVGSTATIEETIVRSTRATKSQVGGSGIAAVALSGKGAELTLTRSLIAKNLYAGVIAGGAKLVVEGCTVRDTGPLADGQFGDGIAIGPRAFSDFVFEGSLDLRSTLVTKNARAGVVAAAASVRLENTALTCNAFDLEVTRVFAVDIGTLGDRDYALEDAGSNVCGCGAVSTCKAQTNALKPVVAE